MVISEDLVVRDVSRGLAEGAASPGLLGQGETAQSAGQSSHSLQIIIMKILNDPYYSNNNINN